MSAADVPGNGGYAAALDRPIGALQPIEGAARADADQREHAARSDARTVRADCEERLLRDAAGSQCLYLVTYCGLL